MTENRHHFKDGLRVYRGEEVTEHTFHMRDCSLGNQLCVLRPITTYQSLTTKGSERSDSREMHTTSERTVLCD